MINFGTLKRYNRIMLLDIGDVLCHVDLIKFVSDLEVFGFSNEEAWDFLIGIQKVQDIGLTTLSVELKKLIVKKHGYYDGLTENIQTLVLQWYDVIHPDETVLNSLNELKKAYKKNKLNIGFILCSNLGKEHADKMNYYLSSFIDDDVGLFYSCRVGAIKPQYSYFKSLFDLYPNLDNCRPYYLDDNIDNINAAKLFDIDAHLFSLSSICGKIIPGEDDKYLKKKIKVDIESHMFNVLEEDLNRLMISDDYKYNPFRYGNL